MRRWISALALSLLFGCPKDPPTPPPEPPPTPPAAECKSDADCRLFSDYCTGCDCRALGPSEPDPTCTGRPVNCIADPCMRRKAECRSGSCELGAVSPP
jgi:hypothetical protein